MALWLTAAVVLTVLSLVLWALWRRVQDDRSADADDFLVPKADSSRDERSSANADEARARLGGRRGS